MKKFLSVLLCLCMLLALTACSGSSGSDTTAAAASNAPEAAFQVGYARVDVTPPLGTGLAGYGNTDERLATEVLDYLYMTCVAVTDAEGTTVLFISVDTSSMGDDTITNTLRSKINSATGIPNGNIMFSASHTHSAPDAATFSTILNSKVVGVVEEALADRKNAEMYIGTGNTEGINFVRHYFDEYGAVIADNHNASTTNVPVRHTTEVDTEMRLIQFKREGGKDVILANWQSHPHITGGSTKTSISADIIGMFRQYLEQDTDCLFAYYQGAAGNINPTSRISEENANKDKNYKVHGQLLAACAKSILQNMTQVETGTIQVLNSTYTAATNKADLDKAVEAGLVRDYYKMGHTISETAKYARENYGIYSIYHANAIINRSGFGDSITIEINAISIGDSVGWITAPYEMFDTNGMYIRENSPYAMTFINGYSNGGWGYIPSAYAYEYGTYESDTTKFAAGTGELLADRYVEMLNELHG